MRKLAELFNQKSKEYELIYKDLNSNKLLNQEKIERLKISEQIILNHVCLSKENSIVDIGCGVGNLLMSLKKKGVKANMHGVDIASKMIDKANKELKNSGYQDLVFTCGDMKDLSFKADVVISLGVSGYQYNQKEFLYQLSNLVVKNGILIFTTGNGDSITRFLRRKLSNIHSRINGKIKRNGIKFQTIKDSQVNSLLFENGFKLEKKLYLTFGLGLVSSNLEISLNRFFFKYFTKNFLSKYLSLTVFYLFRKVK